MGGMKAQFNHSSPATSATATQRGREGKIPVTESKAAASAGKATGRLLPLVPEPPSIHFILCNPKAPNTNQPQTPSGVSLSEGSRHLQPLLMSNPNWSAGESAPLCFSVCNVRGLVPLMVIVHEKAERTHL